MKPQPGSHIALTGSGKQSRRRRKSNFVPINGESLYAWRVGIIQAAWQRVVASKSNTEEENPQ